MGEVERQQPYEGRLRAEILDPRHFYAAYVFDRADERGAGVLMVIEQAQELEYPVRYWWFSSAMDLQGATDRLVASGVGMLPENRKTDGCFFNFEGPKNITISRLKEILRGPFLSLSAERKFGEDYVKRMNIPPTALERSVQFLSGGNQQKVIVARWLFSKARLLIMDEPTQGIDIGAKLEVYNVINELTASGISILFISSDFPELLAISDRVAVVRDGRILTITTAGQLSEYQLIGMASGAGAHEDVERTATEE